VSGWSICSIASRLLLLLLLLFSVSGGPEAGDNRLQVVSRVVGSAAREGDVVLRYGTGFWSAWFRDASRHEKRFSHAGIVISDDNMLYVVHSSASDINGQGTVRQEPLGEFLEEAKDFAVFRFHVSDEIRQRIGLYARSFLGRPFDALFNLDDESRLYCTELVMLSVNRAAGKEMIGPEWINGVPVVTLDRCYLHNDSYPVVDRRDMADAAGRRGGLW
jgi:hypothetical protein